MDGSRAAGLASFKRETSQSSCAEDDIKSSIGFNPFMPRLFSSSPLSFWQRKLLRPKQFVCTKCNQSFGYLGNLSRHRKACEGNFHLKCPYCAKGFYRQDVLKIHLLSKHGVSSTTNN